MDRELPAANDQWLLFVHPEDREAVGKALDATLACGGRFEAAFRVLRADGSVRHVEASASCSWILRASRRASWAVNIDATTCARPNSAGERTTLRTVHGGHPAPHLLLQGRGRALLLVNQAFARMHGGAHKADYIGKTVHDFEPRSWPPCTTTGTSAC
jgi:PAS domain-containing protein